MCSHDIQVGILYIATNYMSENVAYFSVDNQHYTKLETVSGAKKKNRTIKLLFTPQ